MTDPSPARSKSLLLSRRFAPLFWCQFFSAFNDNFLKNALVFLILFKIGGLAEALITLAGAMFIAPFFFLSALGGEIADRFDKAIVARAAETCRDRHLGARRRRLRASFGPDPVRRAVPVRRDRLAVRPDQIRHPARPSGQVGVARGNALVEGATFIAILLGTIVGGLPPKDGGDPASFGA